MMFRDIVGLKLFMASVLTACSISLSAGQLSVLTTGDMHGWIEAQEFNGRIVGGAAELLALWKRDEGYTPGSGKFLLVSAGDIATGPAISTAFRGEPAVKAMNLMGYDVSALGNHEFDFANFESICKWAKFPVLAANVVASDGSPSGLLKGTALFERGGTKVGVIGLIYKDFTVSSRPGGLKGLLYDEPLRKAVVDLRAQGAKLLIVAAHIPQGELCKLAERSQDLGIALYIGGHSHELAQQKVGASWVVSSGEWWRSYTRVDIETDDPSGVIRIISSKQVAVSQSPSSAIADPVVKEEVASWRKALDVSFGEVLGYAEGELSRNAGAPALALKAWLASCPPADIAISNAGAFRQAIAAGELKKLDIVGLMPFDNSLLRLKMTGAQLRSFQMPGGESAVYGGMKKVKGQFILLRTGVPLEDSAVYSVLTNSFLYRVSQAMRDADPNPEVASKDWRTPVIEWLKANPTSKGKPLESLLGLDALSGKEH